MVLILAWASSCFFFSNATTSGFAFCTNFSLDSLMLTDARNFCWYSRSLSNSAFKVVASNCFSVSIKNLSFSIATTMLFATASLVKLTCSALTCLARIFQWLIGCSFGGLNMQFDGFFRLELVLVSGISQSRNDIFQQISGRCQCSIGWRNRLILFDAEIVFLFGE